MKGGRIIIIRVLAKRPEESDKKLTSKKEEAAASPTCVRLNQGVSYAGPSPPRDESDDKVD